MKKIEDIIVEFSSLNYDKKEEYLNSLINEELKDFLPCLKWSSTYTKIGEDILRNRLVAERDEKLNDLGI